MGDAGGWEGGDEEDYKRRLKQVKTGRGSNVQMVCKFARRNKI